ncbi:MAG TPA: MarR family winged helix-turn-helix transcriptional regulator [Allocoleopsis sp.]
MNVDEMRILSALERRPLTVENLAHTLGCPIQEMHEIVQRLWQKGYIDTTRATAQTHNTRGQWILNQLLPWGHPPVPVEIHSNSKTYFILTSKGHLHLHPILSLNQET